TGRLVSARGWVPLLAAAAVLAVNTWPFDFSTDPSVWRERLRTLSLLPFASYAAAGESTLVTGLLRRMAQFAVMAALVRWSINAPGWGKGRTMAVVVGCCVLLAALVEAA